MDVDDKIYVAGHSGMVGSAMVRALMLRGFEKILTRSHAYLDLTEQSAVREFFQREAPDYVFLAAARVGGIHANDTYRAEFLYENLMIQSNIMHSAYQTGVKKLMYFGSSCIYPKLAPQPLKEEYLLTGELEPTNEPYAIAKIAGIKMVESYRRQYGANFISVMPTNLYGPNDNYDLQTSHVLPALLARFHLAKVNQSPYVQLWGTGAARREFLHVDDLADACMLLMQDYDEEQFINVGTGEDLTISELAELIRDIVGFRGDVLWDPSRPNGTPRKVLDVSRMRKLGWRHRIGLREGIESVYETADLGA